MWVWLVVAAAGGAVVGFGVCAVWMTRGIARVFRSH
jgi:hypothetical protein